MKIFMYISSVCFFKIDRGFFENIGPLGIVLYFFKISEALQQIQSKFLSQTLMYMWLVLMISFLIIFLLLNSVYIAGGVIICIFFFGLERLEVEKNEERFYL
jgi:hypothetical protein